LARVGWIFPTAQSRPSCIAIMCGSLFTRVLVLASVLVSRGAPPRSVLYYGYYQDPWCTANGQTCTSEGCCDDRVASKTLLNPENWPDCPGGQPAETESILINPVAPNEHGGLDLDYLGQFYAEGATYYDAVGQEQDWKTRNVISCGGDHDTPYSYKLPISSPVAGPLCVPATPPTALKKSIAALTRRGIRTGISILGGGGGDNIPGIPERSQLRSLTKLEEAEFKSFIVQLRAAAIVLNSWGISHFDIDFEGGIASDLNAARLPEVFEALRFEGGIVSLTTEAYSLQGLSSVLNSTTQRPDLVQLMMGDYSETLATGIQIARNVSAATGYPVSQFRLGIKPQCGVSVGSEAYLTKALPALVESGAGVVLWNLGRDYPCASMGDCSKGCIANSTVGQQPFSSSDPFAFTCAISKALSDESDLGAAYSV